MPEIGRTISHYRINEKLGEGGMGVVFRAEDLTLNRQVAIKVLPEMFSGDPERMARFEREAKLLASLNHPNIASIHGMEEAEGKRFIVMELAEGETLAQRIARGPLPVDESLEICGQITEGLEAAHEKGIIHRDLKPANVKITPEGKVKVLDFGLAKAFQAESAAAVADQSPTMSEVMTRAGVILGTAAYMSPEQAKGKMVDKRTDIWAFGCVLFECLTGKKAFHGETAAETIAAILKAEPDWNLLPPAASWKIKDLLHRCLHKDPRERLHDIADARIEIGESAPHPAESVPAPRRFPLIWLAAGAAVALLAGIFMDRLLTRYFQPAPPASIVTSTIKVEPGYWLDGIRADMQHPSRTAMAISSDGRFLIYSAIEENPDRQGKPRLFLRRLDQSGAKPIIGTDGGINPFLSPDNRWVGFWVNGRLRKIPIEGGVATELCDAPSIFGANWGRDNSIVFADGIASGLSRISAEGGKPETLTKPDPKREEMSHRLPFSLPDGKAVLFTVMRHAWDSQPRLALLRLDTREWHILLPDAADARYVPTGHLVFLRQGTLMAVRFDLTKLDVVGQPVSLAENVMQAFFVHFSNNTAAGQLSVSDTGSLIYTEGGIVPDQKNSLVWVDQQGGEQPVADLQFPFSSMRLSPDGQRIAYVALGREGQVWVYDLARGTNSRLTGEGRATYVTWSPDGKRLIFSWQKSLAPNLFWQPYDGSSPMERITTSEYNQHPGSWSSDGKTVALTEWHPADTLHDIAVLDVPSGRVRPFLNSQFSEKYPEFYPDGRWIAYTSDETKRNEVYVRPFPGPGIKQQVSSNGGQSPLWARNGKQLFYRNQQGQYWAVDVRTDGGFATSKPRLLFEKLGYSEGDPIRDFDLSLDGKRFLMSKYDQRKPTPVTEMILVLNWFEELKRLVPTGKK
ncbi:MAG: serine/threonine-protein kinase [Acidobacteriia bacterium]|nr:serine/threonine-protein kinase [Terriglobia bacterium]